MARKKTRRLKATEHETLLVQVFRTANNRASKELDGFERAIRILKDKEAKEAEQPPVARAG